MAERDGDGVGRVLGHWGVAEAEDEAHGALHLVFRARAVVGDGAFHLGRGVAADGNAGLRGDEEGDGLRLPDGDG